MIDIQKIKKAIILTQNQQYNQAESIYSELLLENPEDEVLLSAFGLFYISTHNYTKAVELLEKAYNTNKTLGTVSALGFAEYERQAYDNCAKYLEESLQYGENIDIYEKLVNSLFEIRKYKKAVEYAEKMYELYPNDIRAIAHKIKALTQSGKLMDAEKMCVENIKKTPNEPILWFHLGYLKELIYSDDKQAKECYKAAAELGTPSADYNIAVSCQKLGEFEEAESYYQKMLKNFPNDIDTMTSYGMCLLTQKKFKEGYDMFFHRRSLRLDKITNNPWKPHDKIDDDIIIIFDQGFGDHIQFIRYLPFLKSKTITAAVPKTLYGLFKQNYPNVNFINYDEVIPDKQALRVTDLAYILNMDFDNIPYSEGYIDSDTLTLKTEKPKVGLCWEAGNAGIRTMINRTIHVKCFEPIFNLTNIQLYSFQYDDTFNGNEKYPQMINLAKDFKNFSDTAKALKAMDVVITVDTAVAHLAGAMGIRTFLLLPYASDWRWFRDTKTTPWYKSIEIFKQVDSISWEKPISDITNYLANFTKS